MKTFFLSLIFHLIINLFRFLSLTLSFDKMKAGGTAAAAGELNKKLTDTQRQLET